MAILRRQPSAKLAGAGPADSVPGGLTASPLPRQEAAGVSSTLRPRHPWVNEYLLGVAAELEDESGPGGTREGPWAAERWTGSFLAFEPSRELPRPSDFQGTRRALGYYDRLLAWRPDSFWGHDRAAVACFRLNRWSQAAGHLDSCLKRRPESRRASRPARVVPLQDGIARQRPRGVQSRDRARRPITPSSTGREPSSASIEGRPADWPEISGGSSCSASRSKRSSDRNVKVGGMGDHRRAGVPALRTALDLDSAGEPASRSEARDAEPRDVDHDDLDTRVAAGRTRSGGPAPAARSRPQPSRRARAIAAAEIDKVLAVNPGHIVARMIRMMDSLEDGRVREAEDDLEQVLSHPELASFLSADPEGFRFLHIAAQRFARQGLAADALKIAEMAISTAVQLGRPRGRSHYYKATVHALAARSDPGQVALAAEELRYAFKANARFRRMVPRPTRSSRPRGRGSTPPSNNSPRPLGRTEAERRRPVSPHHAASRPAISKPRNWSTRKRDERGCCTRRGPSRRIRRARRRCCRLRDPHPPSEQSQSPHRPELAAAWLDGGLARRVRIPSRRTRRRCRTRRGSGTGHGATPGRHPGGPRTWSTVVLRSSSGSTSRRSTGQLAFLEDPPARPRIARGASPPTFEHAPGLPDSAARSTCGLGQEPAPMTRGATTLNARGAPPVLDRTGRRRERQAGSGPRPAPGPDRYGSRPSRPRSEYLSDPGSTENLPT